MAVLDLQTARGTMPTNYDVIVVGAGNAAFCAAHAAREAGANVVMLERAPEAESGGNSRFTAGAIRFAYDSVDDLKALMPDLGADEIATTDFGRYTEDQFFDDMARVTQYRADPDLVDSLVRRSFDTMKWLHAKGMRFVPMYGRQAFKVAGRFKFWGGLTVEAWGGGPGLVARHAEIAQGAGIEIRYGTRATGLLHDGIKVFGVRYRCGIELGELRAPAVVLACGGFEANAEMRTRYLGPGWELAKVRGTRFNTGDGIAMALAVGAMPYGNWSGCHAVGWDRNAPEFGDLAVGDGFQKHSYPFGIMVNARGERFVDEGADLRNYTYAKYGHEILKQPQQFAWQVFDGKVLHLLRDEYRIRQVTRARADTLEELAGQAGRRRSAALSRDRARVQRRGADSRAVRSERQGRPRHHGHRAAQVELGEPARYAAVRGLPGDLRHHLHLRRPADRWRGASARHRAAADSRALCGRRAGRRPVLFQLPRRHRADVRRGIRPARRHLGGEGDPQPGGRLSADQLSRPLPAGRGGSAASCARNAPCSRACGRCARA